MIGIGYTLGRYLSIRFVQAIAAVFATVFGLVYLIDLVELIRRAGDGVDASTAVLARLALFRTPIIAEQVLPFAVLFGSLAAFLGLSRKLELVIARAAGVSVWQFGLPAVMVALSIGVIATALLNPVATNLKRHADALESRLFTRQVEASKRSRFARQLSIDGSAVIRASAAGGEAGELLSAVTVFAFDRNGLFLERIEAESATLRNGYWRLEKVRVLTPGLEPLSVDAYLLATNLSRDEVRQAFGASEAISFWRLPAAIQQLEQAGLDATRYRLRWQSLLAKPLLLIAMVIVAASVSLRFFRFGGVGRLVLGGVGAGFLLYVLTQVASDLGAAGVIGAFTAAWLPAIVGSLLGTLVLLHQEDG
jgi:lipopolysaccharide export system permease protein